MLFSLLQNRRKSKEEEEGNKIEKKKENETEELLSSCVYNKVLWLSACFKQLRRQPYLDSTEAAKRNKFNLYEFPHYLIPECGVL
ncbi:hypothetical protein T09_4288 [Trichinella sp. T9]|nr:hypothetical protein T09_4288 [Trichinella sp. T9]